MALWSKRVPPSQKEYEKLMMQFENEYFTKNSTYLKPRVRYSSRYHYEIYENLIDIQLYSKPKA